MGVVNLAHVERLALVDTLTSVGPDAPTLCEGWTTRDLVAHLIVRERRPDTGPGILIKQFAGYTDRVRLGEAKRDWDDLLDRLASGPPVYSPFKPIDRFANLAEMFVHHEDVLRGGAEPDGTWTPRALSPELAAALVSPVKSMGKMAIRSGPAAVSLVSDTGETLAAGGHGEPVTVTGTTGELTLFAFGRRPLDLQFSGDPAAVEAVRTAHRGF